MTLALERRLLQGVIALACLVPLVAGATGIVVGASWLDHGVIERTLDSHFRYMSGIFFGVGLGFVSCISKIDIKGPRLRLLSGFVVIGGLARLLSRFEVGVPGTGHSLALVMELIVVPCLVLWQAGFARRALRV